MVLQRDGIIKQAWTGEGAPSDVQQVVSVICPGMMPYWPQFLMLANATHERAPKASDSMRWFADFICRTHK